MCLRMPSRGRYSCRRPRRPTRRGGLSVLPPPSRRRPRPARSALLRTRRPSLAKSDGADPELTPSSPRAHPELTLSRRPEHKPRTAPRRRRVPMKYSRSRGGHGRRAWGGCRAPCAVVHTVSWQVSSDGLGAHNDANSVDLCAAGCWPRAARPIDCACVLQHCCGVRRHRVPRPDAPG